MCLQWTRININNRMIEDKPIFRSVIFHSDDNIDIQMKYTSGKNYGFIELRVFA